MWNKLHIKLAKSNKYVTVTSFSLIDAKCNNASFHKTALACTLLVSAAMQLRWCDIFYSISDRNDENRNQRCWKNKSGTIFWNIVYIHSSCCLLLISRCSAMTQLSDRKNIIIIRPVNSWVLVCWWWWHWFDWSFARLIAPVVTNGYRSFVRRVICPKCSCADSEIWRQTYPNPNSNANPSPNPNLNLT